MSLDLTQFGQQGVIIETGTTTVTGNFRAIQVLTDATFSTWEETGAGGDAMTGFSIPAGVVIYGRITTFTLSAGRVRAYL